MIRTNKDLVFAITVILWLTSSILCYIVYGDTGVCISNIVCSFLFSIIVLIKLRYRRFSLWLEKKYNGKST